MGCREEHSLPRIKTLSFPSKPLFARFAEANAGDRQNVSPILHVLKYTPKLDKR